jgi:signal transduction histidine kinase
MRLRTFYILLVFAFVVPVVLFCGIALNELRTAQTRSAIGRIEESVHLTAQLLDEEVRRMQAVLQTLARSHALAKGDLARFYDEATAANAGRGAWIILYASDGRQLANTRLPRRATLPAHEDLPQLARVIERGESRIGGLRFDPRLSTHYVLVEQPVVAANGQRYLLAQALSSDYFTSLFSTQLVPSTWRAALLDRNGVRIARNHAADHLIGKPIDGVIRNATVHARAGVIRNLTAEGTQVYDVFQRTTRSDWTVIIGAPVDEIDPLIWRGMGVMGLGLAIATGLALMLAMIGGRHLVRFVDEASVAATRLGQGEPIRELAQTGVQELERLRRAIAEASQRVQTEMARRARAERERNDLLVREQEARANAEEQNHAKDEFLAMLGHELRNPLSALSSAVALLDQPGLRPELADKARAVLRRQCSHLGRLVDDLLEANRALMGKITLHARPLDLAEIIQRCVETLQGSERAAGFQLKVHTEPCIVHGDATRLTQIIDNILDNSVKYSPGGGTIDIELRRHHQEALLTIRDTGMGIAPELLPRVFDVFVQGKQPLQRAQGGLGVGLSLVRRLVELHGGSVSVASPGLSQGTEVSIRLPIHETGTTAAGSPPVLLTAGRKRVLLIEDNDDAREMMVALLQLAACEVSAASNAIDGIALARQDSPDLAFIDIGLPGMDGFAVARALKDDPRTAGIELVALTGYGAAEDRERALASGFGRHFTKPIGMDELQQVLA